MSTNPPSYQPPYQPQGPPPGPQGPPPGYGPPPKKTNPIVWVLVGIGAFILLIVLALAGFSVFVMHKARQAGLDPEMVRRNPGVAVVKMMAALNPNIEIVALDESRGVVTVHDKKSDKTYTVNFDDAKRGKFTINEGGRETVSVNTTGDGKDGTVEVKSADGTVKIGAGANVKPPVWIPDYPGSEPQGAYSAQSANGDSGSYHFTTRDSADKVAHFYENEFKSGGLKTNTTITNAGGSGLGGMVSGEDESRKHSAYVLIGSDNGQTTVNVTFTSKR